MKFLGQAKKFFKVLATEPETKAQHFNVRCISGHRVRGERTEGYQALRCPACGEGVFVLPRSPLPNPLAPQRSAAPKSARTIDRVVAEGPVELTDPARVSVEIGGDERAVADADIIWDDAPPEPVRQAAPQPAGAKSDAVDLGIAGPPDAASNETARRSAPASAPATRVRGQGKPQAKRPAARSATEGGSQTAAAHEDRLLRRQKPVKAAAGRGGNGNGEPELVLEIKPAKGIRALHRWLFVLVPVLVIATVAWRYRQYRLQDYPVIVEKGRTDGIPALDQGEFDKANQLLSSARSAVDSLGGAVEGADEIRQAALEAAIFVDLITQDLGDLLGEAGRADPESWATRFDSLYKGRSIFVDSIITAVPDGTPSSGYELMFRVLPPGEASNREGRPDRVGVIDLTGFQLFELARPEKDNRVIFGARLASFKYDDVSNLWVVRLVPKSGVFITHTKALDAIGWRGDSDVNTEMPMEDRP